MMLDSSGHQPYYVNNETSNVRGELTRKNIWVYVDFISKEKKMRPV